MEQDFEIHKVTIEPTMETFRSVTSKELSVDWEGWFINDDQWPANMLSMAMNHPEWIQYWYHKMQEDDYNKFPSEEYMKVHEKKVCDAILRALPISPVEIPLQSIEGFSID